MQKSNKLQFKQLNVIIISVLIGLIFLITLFLFLASKNIIALKKDPKNFTVMIDPGHGGADAKDGGAMSNDGTKEYELNEQVSKKLYNSLISKGYNVLYSRNPDKHTNEMTLTERTEIANIKKIDLFISIHHDASSNKNLNGYTVYYSSYKYELDSNDTVVYNNNIAYEFVSEEIKNDKTIIYYKDKNGELRNSSSGGVFTIIDHTPSEPALKSKDTAEIIDKNLSELDYINPLYSNSSSLKDNDHRVLRRVNCPSVLVECGFISNQEEFKQIKLPSNQNKLVNKLTKSINEYFGVW